MTDNAFTRMGYKMGYLKDTYDHRDHLHMIPLDMPEMPPKFDLKGKIKQIFTQRYNDCSANVISNVVMSLKEDDLVVSRLFQYYNSRFLAEPDFITDSGATYRDALKGLQKFGFVNEEVWHYVDDNLNEIPSTKAFTEGLSNTDFIRSYRKLAPTLPNIQYTLFSGHLIMLGIAIYSTFLSLDSKAVVPLPNKEEDAFCGLHAVLMCGYDNDLQACLCLNSWGTSFGNGGYFYLPYLYVLDSNLAFDFWVISTKI